MGRERAELRRKDVAIGADEKIGTRQGLALKGIQIFGFLVFFFEILRRQYGNCYKRSKYIQF